MFALLAEATGEKVPTSRPAESTDSSEGTGQESAPSKSWEESVASHVCSEHCLVAADDGSLVCTVTGLSRTVWADRTDLSTGRLQVKRDDMSQTCFMPASQRVARAGVASSDAFEFAESKKKQDAQDGQTAAEGEMPHVSSSSSCDTQQGGDAPPPQEAAEGTERRVRRPRKGAINRMMMFVAHMRVTEETPRETQARVAAEVSAFLTQILDADDKNKRSSAESQAADATALAATKREATAKFVKEMEEKRDEEKLTLMKTAAMDMIRVAVNTCPSCNNDPYSTSYTTSLANRFMAMEQREIHEIVSCPESTSTFMIELAVNLLASLHGRMLTVVQAYAIEMEGRRLCRRLAADLATADNAHKTRLNAGPDTNGSAALLRTNQQVRGSLVSFISSLWYCCADLQMRSTKHSIKPGDTLKSFVAGCMITFHNGMHAEIDGERVSLIPKMKILLRGVTRVSPGVKRGRKRAPNTKQRKAACAHRGLSLLHRCLILRPTRDDFKLSLIKAEDMKALVKRVVGNGEGVDFDVDDSDAMSDDEDDA